MALVFNLWYQYNYFCLIGFAVVAWTIIAKFRDSRFGDNVSEKVFALDLIVFFLFNNVVFSSNVNDSTTKLCLRSTVALLTTSPTSYQVHHNFGIPLKNFFYLINFVWMITFEKKYFSYCGIIDKEISLLLSTVLLIWFSL